MSYYEDRIKTLEARIEEMAKLNRMKAVPVEAKLMERIGELNKENARLKAEVERLTAFTTRTIIPNEELQAQVERLTKAGDVTSQRLHWFCQKWGWKDDDLKTLTPEWNAAKDGKQP